MLRLDRTGQRIVGVLIEKQLSVPDSYPLTENALVAGCNQTSNRDPVMDLQPFQVTGALLQLHEAGVVARVEGAGRVPKFRHRLDEHLDVQKPELAVLAELLLRGPQAPGALKPRVARMGFHAGPTEIDQLLQRLASQGIVERLPLGPRERDQRWQHLLGDGSQAQVPPSSPAGAAPASGGAATAAAPVSVDDLLRRLTALERRVQALEAATGLEADDDPITS